jgi:hypothetical protein
MERSCKLTTMYEMMWLLSVVCDRRMLLGGCDMSLLVYENNQGIVMS